MDCDEAARFAKESGVDGIIAFGGGSVMDTAKAVAVLITHGGSINDWEGAGTLIAGIAFGKADVGSVHCISEAIGGLYDTPHGVANSIFLPYIFEFNVPANIERHAEVAYALGVDRNLSPEEAAKKGIEILFEMSAKVNIPKFKDVPHVDPKDFTLIAEKSKMNGSDKSNAREMSVTDYFNILHKAYAAS